MTVAPAYFEPIRDRAARRWIQLEADPELAAPWHQLFKQVQSPRHVLSELLQNADDADASEAAAWIEGGHFFFTHNGADFAEDHFASLCRFGYSNKRSLHTIGFRGIGFKSLFSLGDTVELRTPSLSIAFDKTRFTEPRWLGSVQTDGLTEIRVALADEHRQRDIEKNLREWRSSSVSLLFFRKIRKLRIGQAHVHWVSVGPGPVADTEWMALHDDPEQRLLIARSPAEPFPEEALAEIKRERLLSIDQETEFPPCRVEIVLGARGRLYVVLPTGIETQLPFACNAPFVQDPARLKIKDPQTSPTNRWLLERAGKLAGSIMLDWLGQSSLGLPDRAKAYALLPSITADSYSIEGDCGKTCEQAFFSTIAGRPLLLSHAGELTRSQRCVVVPDALMEIWPVEQVATLLDEETRPPLTHYVAPSHREKLEGAKLVEAFGKDALLAALERKRPPRPSWRQLLKLWAYVTPEVAGHRYFPGRERLCIVPVQGQDVLFAAQDVVRIGEKRLLHSESDWDFLATHLVVLNQNWSRYLTEHKRLAEEQNDKEGGALVDAALACLARLGLSETSDVNNVMEQVAASFFARPSIGIADCVRLAQICARLNAATGASFRFITEDERLRATEHGVIFDQTKSLSAVFPETWVKTHFLHLDYGRSVVSCTAEEWQRWTASGQAGLFGFAPLAASSMKFWSKGQIEAELRKRGFTDTPFYHFKTPSFRVEDWDFHSDLWAHWHKEAKSDDRVWGRIVEHVLAQPQAYWWKGRSARALHVASTGSTRAVTTETLLPAWILKLRELACLRDTRGLMHKPSDLMLRTPETEALMDVEPFVHGRLDREGTRPLLQLLGVRDVPTGPDRLLGCLRALAKSAKPPGHEVEKWYRRLDQLILQCSTSDFENVKEALHKERIILTEDGDWASGAGVFLVADEDDAPGAALIRVSVRDLALWRRIGIAERPNTELAVRWLKTLSSGEVLSQDDARRAKALQARHASRVWYECGHWLNLAGEWVPTDTLKYALTMQSLVAWSHLHPWAKQQTADLQRLSAETVEAAPFSGLPRLADAVEDRIQEVLAFGGEPKRVEWLRQLGLDLQRVKLDNEGDTTRARARGADLAKTLWQTVPTLETIPYIDGTPAGVPRQAEALWVGGTLYVGDRSPAKLARAVAQELGRFFRRQDIADAIKLCFDRSREFVTDYLDENFELVKRESISLPEHVPMPSANGARHDTNSSVQEVQAAEQEAGGTIFLESTTEQATASEVTPERQEEDIEPILSPSRTPRTPKTSLIERFALAHGFRKAGDDRYRHTDGSLIQKSEGALFPWERRTGTGDLLRYYLPKEQCLEQDPLELKAEWWAALEKSPDTYAFLLLNPQGEPMEMTGTRLRALRAAHEIVLHPATYRLVQAHDEYA